MFNNPYNPYNQGPRITKYGPTPGSPFFGGPPPFIPASPLGRPSALASGIGGGGGYPPYGVVQRRPLFPPPVLYPVATIPGYFTQEQSDCGHDCCESNCLQTQATAHRWTNPQLKTKDVLIRKKAFSVRESYLIEQPKFEKELGQYVDKKDKTAIPDRVINLLFSFINQEEYCNSDPHDEVTLCILAFNVNSRSTVKHSLGNLKEIEDNIDNPEILVDIIITILRSSDVPDKLKDWLEKFMRDKVPWDQICFDPKFQAFIHEYPETYMDLLVLLGLSPKRQPLEHRVL